MGRYRKELTHPEREIARLAEETSHLRRELEQMVRNRRRTDGFVSHQGFSNAAVPRTQKKRSRDYDAFRTGISLNYGF